MNYLWPQIPSYQCAEDWQSHLTVDGAHPAPDLSVKHCRFTATGGNRLPDERIRQLREFALQEAMSCGYPGASSIESRRMFDCKLAAVLRDEFPMGAGEASRPEVWSWIATRMLPDLARWRFPGTDNMDRFRGGRNLRNVFQRLWWRAELLKDESRLDDPYWLMKVLKEDALVGLTERTRMARNRTLLLDLAKAIESENLDEDAWRTILLETRQKTVFVDPLVLRVSPTSRSAVLAHTFTNTQALSGVVSEADAGIQDTDKKASSLIFSDDGSPESASFRKVLSANELGLTGSHQAGILVPKADYQTGFFGKLDPDVKNPDAWLNIRISGSTETFKVRLIHYNSRRLGLGTRDEFRLTNIAPLMKALQPEEGDTLILRDTVIGLIASIEHSSEQAS